MNTWYSRIEPRLAVVRSLWRGGDALLAVHVFCFAAAAPLLARLPLSRIERMLESGRERRAASLARETHIGEVVLAVLRAGRPLLRKGCLVRGLTLYYFLRRAGADVQLSFGLGTAGANSDVFGDGYDGHCWLVKDGEPFLEARDPRPFYMEMYSFPSADHSTAAARLYAEGKVFGS